VSCRAYHDLLQRVLDGDPVADRATLERHLGECPACRELHAAADRLQRGLRLLTPPRPPAALAARLSAAVLADRRARRRTWLRRYVGLALAAAACLLAAFLTKPFWLGGPNRDPERHPAPPEMARNNPPERTPTLRASMEEAGTAVASLTARTAAKTWGPTRKLLTALPEVRVAPPFDPSAVSMREATLSVREGLEPVTNSARRAVDLLLRELPAGLADKVGL
jgi:hypothetical protein